MVLTTTLPFDFIRTCQAILRLWLKGERRVFERPTPRVGEVAQEIDCPRGGGIELLIDRAGVIVVMYRELDTWGNRK